mgnify:CR=1 FL=1
MPEPMLIDLSAVLSADALIRLQEEVKIQERPLHEILRDALDVYFEYVDEDDEFEDTPDEVIAASLRQAFLEIEQGLTRPVEELFSALDSLDPMTARDANKNHLHA